MTNSRGLSLHIGVNHVDPEHYGGSWDGKLEDCENDCADMHRIARRQGFEASSLRSAWATRTLVTEAIRNAATQLRKGDFFLLTYSGHGGTIPDVDGDEEDQVDETWCLYDGQLLDDELNLLWAEFNPGVRLLVVSDSCHSGTMLRDISPDFRTAGQAVDPDEVFERSRAMPRQIARSTARKNRQFYADLQRQLPNPRPEIKATVRLLSGCQEDELSYEGRGNGRFTAALKRTYADGQFEGDYQSFHRKIREQLKHKQRPNHMVHGLPNPEYDRENPFTI
jgi:hypothetical protein